MFLWLKSFKKKPKSLGKTIWVKKNPQRKKPKKTFAGGSWGWKLLFISRLNFCIKNNDTTNDLFEFSTKHCFYTMNFQIHSVKQKLSKRTLKIMLKLPAKHTII